jgi:hypothetical protein
LLVYPNIQQRIKEKQEAMDMRLKKHSGVKSKNFVPKTFKLKVGDEVMFKLAETLKQNQMRGKFDAVYGGPGIIHKILNNGKIQIEDANQGTLLTRDFAPEMLKMISSPEVIIDSEKDKTGKMSYLVHYQSGDEFWCYTPSVPRNLIQEYKELQMLPK